MPSAITKANDATTALSALSTNGQDSLGFGADDILFTARSIIRVLEGVAVATKAPAELIHALIEQVRNLREQDRLDEPSTPDDSDAHNIPCSALSLSEWRKFFAYSPELCRAGGRQVVDVALAISFLRDRSRNGEAVPGANLDAIWRLIYKSITSAHGTDLHFAVSRSAQGFLAVPLCSLIREGRIEELFRFHVWLPDGERGLSDVAIHSHQPFAQSWILAGSGTDRRFDVKRVEKYSPATHAEYAICFTDNKQTGVEYKTHQVSSTVTNTGRLLQVRPTSSEVHTRDMSYSVPSGAYHSSIVKGDRFHATLFFFDAQRGFVADAGVTGPKDGKNYTQIRDPGGITSQTLAEMANAIRLEEQGSGSRSHRCDEHAVVSAYYNFFTAHALLQSGRYEEAVRQFNLGREHSPLSDLMADPTWQHGDFVKALARAGDVLS